VSIGETTFGGREDCATQPECDYGSLMYLALQRAKTAREALQVMIHLLPIMAITPRANVLRGRQKRGMDSE
jgi:hypothetical protein